MVKFVRIVVLDYYMATPTPCLDVTYSEFRGTAISQVPVLRCFGSLENGKKICVHIHGVFPYLYIPYDGRGKPETLMYKIANALDKAINVSFNQASSNAQHIYKISLVSGIPMYGYHSTKHQFFKIYIYNPKLISKVGSLLLNKHILDQVFQPHEIHLNFTLQFMIDYNLHGMSNMLISEIRYRVNPDNTSCDIDEHLFLPRNIEKTSSCELEADINAESILNRQEILSGNLAANPGIAALWEDEKQRRRNKNEDSQLGHFLELKNITSMPTKSHLIFQQALKERLAALSADKDIPKINPEVSIYPAETPSGSHIQNASLIDIQSSSSLELSLNDTLSASYSQGNNETILSNGEDVNTTMDQEAQDFLKLLEELALENVTENEKEEESILSQIAPEDDEKDDSAEFLDLSMPITSFTTPTKIDNQPANQRSDDEDADYFNTTLVPQVDGQIEYTDSDDEPLSKYLTKEKFERPKDLNKRVTKTTSFSEKSRSIRSTVRHICNKSMPLLDDNNSVPNIFSTKSASLLNHLNPIPYVRLNPFMSEAVVKIEPLDTKKILGNTYNNRKRRKPEDILEETLRLMRFRIKRIVAKSRLKKIGRLVSLYENITESLLRKKISPKFNVLPGIRSTMLESSTKVATNNTIISCLLVLTHNYTDPDLHIFVTTPSNEHFLSYRGYTFPKAIQLPLNLTRSQKSLLCENHGKSEKVKNGVAIRRRKLTLLQKQILNIKPKGKRVPRSRVKKKCDAITSMHTHSDTNIFQSPSTIKPANGSAPLEAKNQLLKDIEEADAIIQRRIAFLKSRDSNVDNVKSDPSYHKTKDSSVGHLFSTNPLRDSYKQQPLVETMSDIDINDNLDPGSLSKSDKSSGQIYTESMLIKEIIEANKRAQKHLQHLKADSLTENNNASSCYSKNLSDIKCLRTKEDEEKDRADYNHYICAEYDKGADSMRSDLSQKKFMFCDSEVDAKMTKLDVNENIFCQSSIPNSLYYSMKIEDTLSSDNSLASHRSKETISLTPNPEEAPATSINSDSFLKSESDFVWINNLECCSGTTLNPNNGLQKLLCSSSGSDRTSCFVSPTHALCDSDSELFLTRMAPNLKNPFKGSNLDSDNFYKSTHRKFLTQNCFCNLEEEIDAVLKPADTHLASRQQSSCQVCTKCDVQLPSHFKAQFVQHSSSSTPFGIGIGATEDLLTTKIVTRTQEAPKPIRKLRRTLAPMYINCDGAADSSSEDEQKPKFRRKTVRRKLSSSPYAPLGITVTRSPRMQGNCLGDSIAQISGDLKHYQESSSQIDQPDLININASYKRKLVFEHEIPLNKTTFEEIKSCTYSTKSGSSTKLSRSVYQNVSCDTNITSDAHISKSNQNCINAGVVEAVDSQNSRSHSSDSDLFSEVEDLNRSFFKEYNLTVSEKYDNAHKYKAKEGCSTVFSLGSGTDSIPNLKSPENKMLSGSISSDIPPYQYNERLSSNDPVDGKETKACSLIRNHHTGNIIMPLLKAPSRQRIEASMGEFSIPRIQQEEPYYSNVEDYTGVVEIGHRIMRIASKTTAHLAEFDTDFNGLNNHRKYFVECVTNLTWNSNNIKSLKLTHCSNQSVIVQPVRKPPSPRQVREWVKVHSKSCEEVRLSSKPRYEQTKIHIPRSPGNDSVFELSLSLTPYTVSQPSSQDVQFDNHTHSPNSQTSSSRLLDQEKKKCKMKTLINSKPSSLRDSVLLSDETNKSYQITGVSRRNSFEFEKSVQNLQAARAFSEHQYLTTMVMELHIRSRGELKPDPQLDCICAIFYSILCDAPADLNISRTRGVIAINRLPMDLGALRPNFLDGIEIGCDITYVENEESLINSFVSLIRCWDPDIFAGYEIEMLSWGYLVERASVISINILPLLSRSQLHKYGTTKLKSLMSEVESNIIGRIVLDVWRLMRHEVALQSYTFESIVYHILHRRIPMYAFMNLTFWWDHRTNLYRHRVVRYYLQRVDTILELFDKLDFLNRTSELAKLFGILFYEVLSRGSQFRVESMMLRLAKPLNYIPVSPDTQQRAKMKAPEYIALVMEPESKFYTDPVIVLDFQSLYPSIIIAYNYCFTTCVGRVNHLGTNNAFEFGASQLKVPKKIIEKLSKRDLLNFSPCGVAFVKQKVREGILPRMLKEVLDTRFMVKNSMKENKEDNNLQKVLHNRQLGLKLIANVTYGYTAANFSGRMCCVEVGDSVVSKGRETLQRAIALVEGTPEWQAKVVYGDTDSMFVLVSGKTRDEAFEIGKKIADAVTADNPDPVKLKLEKVYQPCILQTKKRYVGYMYESPEQEEPVYEAKGIETVRRDGCPAVSKMLQKCLTLLFETKNVSLIKSYVLKQFNKIQTGRASIQDLTFAKEYRGASGYKPGACVPALELARKWKVSDRRSEPRSGERVPYIIVNGPPGLPLIRLVKSPRDLLNDSSLRPNALYYITKVIIPPINRCLNLIGADLNIWFNQMPRKNVQYLPNSSPTVKSTISQYFITKICACCSSPTQDGLCTNCCLKPNVTALILTEKLKKWEAFYNNTLLICQSCTGCLGEIACSSLDCPVLYRRTQTNTDLQQSTYVRELLTTSVFSEDHFFKQKDVP